MNLRKVIGLTLRAICNNILTLGINFKQKLTLLRTWNAKRPICLMLVTWGSKQDLWFYPILGNVHVNDNLSKVCDPRS